METEVLDEADKKSTIAYKNDQFLYDDEMEELAGLLRLVGESKVPTNSAAKLFDHGPLMLAQDAGVPG